MNVNLGYSGHVCLIDAHAHLHDCFRLGDFLGGAFDNLRQAARHGAAPARWTGYLLLADLPGQDLAARLDGVGAAGDWSIRPARERGSWLACIDDEPKLVLIAGKQLNSREGIEVLAVGAEREPAKLPLGDLIDQVGDLGAIAIIPWGFGKWWFGRGRVVRDLVGQGERQEADDCRLFLGDTAVRPACCPTPHLFSKAQLRRMRVLAGSDPLNLPWHSRRAGRLGVALEATPNFDTPWSHLRQLLQESIQQLPLFGSLDSLSQFCRDQIALRFVPSRRRFAA